VGKGGRTPYERKRGRKCRTPACKFGEQVHYRELATDKKGLDTPWHLGIWLGHARESNEHVIGTSLGVIRAHSIKRQEPSKQWNADAIRTVVGSPQQPDPNRASYKIPLKVNFDEPNAEDNPTPTAPVPSEPHIRRTAITAEMLKEYGYTEGCYGCQSKAAGLDARRHSEACRARIWEAMEANETHRRRKEAQQKRFAYRQAAREEESQQNTAAEGAVVHGPYSERGTRPGGDVTPKGHCSPSGNVAFDSADPMSASPGVEPGRGSSASAGPVRHPSEPGGRRRAHSVSNVGVRTNVDRSSGAKTSGTPAVPHRESCSGGASPQRSRSSRGASP